jgi:hypothetical protein
MDISISQEDPRLWYGIGILYDRYGSLDHAEEAFSSVLRMDKCTSSLGFHSFCSPHVHPLLIRTRYSRLYA